ncbi:MAG: bifunctional hydroxymethylpyrimidine kinase/phosphomethylpyrimidine kinase [Rudaea sp.]|nr:bifunctional hydroxymethylpyrimidine kinase/phosphomethylpyrimidine kinase [Rudaea sp.]
MPRGSAAAKSALRKNNKNSTAGKRAVSVLTIAGSDSGGCAGTQADLKTFAAMGLHGLSVITAITAQNTCEIVSVHRVPIKQVEQQLQALFADFDIAAVKIGMLGSAATIRAVASFLREHCRVPIVLDPVIVSSSGSRLLPARALVALREELVPVADILTPNVPEASAFLGRLLITPQDLRNASRDLLGLGAKSVLLKGGHHEGDPVCDYLIDASGTNTFCHVRLPILVRGTGCVLSAAIAAGLAQGRTRVAAVRVAEEYLQDALRRAYRAGKSAFLTLPPGLTGE